MTQLDTPAALEASGPVAVTPLRARPSTRRTSHIDIIRGDGGGGELSFLAGARDLTTARDGSATVACTAALRARVGADRRLLDLWTAPEESRLSAVVGRVVGSGFRASVARSLPDHADAGTPLHLLLDDLPIAALLSERSRHAAMLRDGRADPTVLYPEPDVCAGWRRGGTTLGLAAEGRLPFFVGPEAPPLDAGDDALAWHTVERLAARAMRRRRRIDVAGGDPLRVDAMFRDTYADDDGVEHVLHEYSITAEVDPRSLVVLGAEIVPGVLPHADCIDAAPTAGGIRGVRVPLLRNYVDQALFGPSTCTHLNDLLRSLADVGHLAALA